MKRRVISMLAAIALLATVSAPGVIYAEGDVDMTVSTGGSLQTKGDGESGSLDSILDANASIMGALGNTSWTIRAESVQKTGKWRDDLVAVAQSQVGYAQESDGNTIYGEWLGEQSAAWDAAFVSWVADQAGLTEKQFPHAATYDALVEKLTKLGAVKQISKANYPNTGDIALLKINDETRMGVIAYVSGGYAAVILGSNCTVARETYQIDGKEFQSYVDLNVLMSRAGLEVSKGDEVTIPEGGVAAWTNTDSVYMRKEATTASKKVTMVKKSGTALLVTSAEKQEDGYVWYGVTYKEYTGYIRGDLIKLDEINQPAATEAPKADVCDICGANGESESCLYAELAGKSAQESYAFLLNLLENDRAAFDRYVKCHDAHVAQGAAAVICGNGCSQTLTNLTAPGAAHSEGCPWHAEEQLGVEERVVNIEIVEATEGQEINITFDVYGAQAYEWHEVITVETGVTDEIIPNNSASPNMLTITAKSTANTTYSYYCVAYLMDKGSVKSKITTINVTSAPIVAEAVLGEEVKFTYKNENAATYKWYIYDAETGKYTVIDPTDLSYIGANTATLGFYATEEKSANIYVCKAYVDDAEVSTSGQYQLTILNKEADLCKYVEELANMSPDERDAVLNVTWNIDLPGIGNLAQAVKAHWSSCENDHKKTYPSLFDDNAENNGNVRENESGSADFFTAFSSCEAFAELLPAEHALLESWGANNVSAMTIYSGMLALRDAPGYTANGEKYSRYFVVAAHIEACEAHGLHELLCNCEQTIGVAPGSVHDENCPWHMDGVDSAALTERITTEEGFAEWAETATPEMIARALTVKSLDHVALEANTDGTYNMYVVRYAEPVGTVDAKGYLTYKGIVIGWIDFTTNTVYPLSELPDNAPAL